MKKNVNHHFTSLVQKFVSWKSQIMFTTTCSNHNDSGNNLFLVSDQDRSFSKSYFFVNVLSSDADIPITDVCRLPRVFILLNCSGK